MLKNLSSTKKIDFESMNLWNEWMKKKIDCAFLNRSQNSKRRRKCFCVNFQLCRKVQKMNFVCQKKWFNYRSILIANLRNVILLYCIQTKKSKNSINEFRWIEWFYVWRKWQLKKKNLKKWKKKQYSFDFVDKYREYLIFQFSEMKRNERLWNDRLLRIRINERLSVQKKKLLTEMLYRRKICLIWKFSKIEKIRSKINLSVKIRTIFH